MYSLCKINYTELDFVYIIWYNIIMLNRKYSTKGGYKMERKKYLSEKETIFFPYLLGENIKAVLATVSCFCSGAFLKGICNVNVQIFQKGTEKRVYASLIFPDISGEKKALNQWLFNIDSNGNICRVPHTKLPLMALIYLAENYKMLTIIGNRIQTKNLFFRNTLPMIEKENIIPNSKLAVLSYSTANSFLPFLYNFNFKLYNNTKKRRKKWNLLKNIKQ